jgi:hypothetical protein
MYYRRQRIIAHVNCTFGWSLAKCSLYFWTHRASRRRSAGVRTQIQDLLQSKKPASVWLKAQLRDGRLASRRTRLPSLLCRKDVRCEPSWVSKGVSALAWVMDALWALCVCLSVRCKKGTAGSRQCNNDLSVVA